MFQLNQLLFRAALRRQPGGLGLEAGPYLQDRGQVLCRAGRHGAAIKDGFFHDEFAHEGAHAVTGFHQATRLQLRNRLADHAAADAESLDELRLGGQFFANFQLSRLDFFRELFHHLVGQGSAPFLDRAGIEQLRNWHSFQVTRNSSAIRGITPAIVERNRHETSAYRTSTSITRA